MDKKDFHAFNITEYRAIILSISKDRRWENVLAVWINKWKNEIKGPHIASKEGNRICITLRGNKTTYFIDTDNSLLLNALVLLINLTQPTTLAQVENKMSWTFPAKLITKELPCRG